MLVLAHGGESQGLEDSGAVACPLVLGLMQAYWQSQPAWSLVVGSRGPRAGVKLLVWVVFLVFLIISCNSGVSVRGGELSVILLLHLPYPFFILLFQFSFKGIIVIILLDLCHEIFIYIFLYHF